MKTNYKYWNGSVCVRAWFKFIQIQMVKLITKRLITEKWHGLNLNNWINGMYVYQSTIQQYG